MFCACVYVYGLHVFTYMYMCVCMFVCGCDWLWAHWGQRQEQRTWEHKKSAAREGLESAVGWVTVLLLLAVKSHSRKTLHSGP